MTTSSTNAHSTRDIEQLLVSLSGVLSASVILADEGRIDEIHILCSPLLMPKQVVRNIESALAAGLGIHIDRRVVSVAQLREDIAELAPPHDADAAAIPTADSAPVQAPTGAPHVTPEPAPAAAERHDAGRPAPNAAPNTATDAAQPSPAHERDAAARPAAGRKDRRFVFVGFDARTQGGGTICRVAIRRGRTGFEGAGSGPNTPQGRACAAAEALFHAVAQADDAHGIGLDGAVIVELSGKRFVLVSAQGAFGREPVQLTGVAALARSPEEAAILAALQAANRWAEPR